MPHAIAQMFSARVVAMLVGLGGTAILARLLTPSDFGTFAFGLAVFTVAQAVSEFGLMEYLVRREELTIDDLRSGAGLALTLAVGLAAVATLGLAVTGRIDDTDTAGVVGFLAAALVAEAIAMPYEARRRRSIEFRFLSALTVVQTTVELGAGAALALAGFGPVALAAALFASRITAAILLLVACPSAERPWPQRSGWGRFRGFGGRFVAARLLPRLGELTIVALITRGLGVGPLGIYNRSGAVYSIPDRTIFEAINPVILPALSKALRDNTSAARVYLDKVDYLAAVCWPAFGAMAVLAEPIVGVLLGPQWVDAVGPVRILTLAGLFWPFTKMSMKLFIAMDRIDIHLRVQALTVAATVIGAGIGSFSTLEAVCAGLVVAQFVQVTAVWRGITVGSGESMRMPWSVILRNLALVLSTLAGPVALSLWADLPDLAFLGLGVLFGGLGWTATIVATKHRLVDDVRSLRVRPSHVQ